MGEIGVYVRLDASAAIARAHDAVLVTHNSGEFERVIGLRMEDWALKT